LAIRAYLRRNLLDELLSVQLKAHACDGLGVVRNSTEQVAISAADDYVFALVSTVADLILPLHSLRRQTRYLEDEPRIVGEVYGKHREAVFDLLLAHWKQLQ